MHNTNNIEMHSKENETKSSVMVGFKGTEQKELPVEKIDSRCEQLFKSGTVHQ
jgi:hypothetical protein